MREITTHKVHEGDRQPLLLAIGEIGTGGAEQSYRITYTLPDGRTMHLPIDFISLKDEGITNEVLLAIVIDRLEGYQAGPYACAENGVALECAQAALRHLHDRTRSRIARGVENQAKA